ncbi:LysR family transcriptional regulator [Actinacidiphila paucisporea]|uniref:DNA-binding transcriptional regulator, LysR family n=1 Tax=Actinacidiphila paucisporea TaxID=310782 RepID=A0A1M7QG61_9ACTN|nr:LysR family transcriptional regulator [Actinacidiphila paucisporea]SHN29914.1 DNA-binding transcriptional regulator, LysR family [Actinacidiphila paucisporea]
MLDVRRLNLLRAVVTSGSITAAARNLGYSPSAVSQQITLLEKEAGISLLERIGRGVRPTAAGRLLAGHAGIISHNLAEAETALADLRAGRTGRLAIRYMSSIGPTVVAPALSRLRKEHPGLRIDLRLIDPEDPLSVADENRADLTIMVGSGRSVPQGVHLVHLLDDAYRAVLPSGHPLAAQRTVDLAELAGEAWVGSEAPGPCLVPITDACAAAGFSPNFAASSEDYATAQAFVAAGLGVCLIPRTGLGNRHPGVAVRRVRRPEPVRTIYAAVPETTLEQPALRALLEALKDAAKDEGPTTPRPRRG